MGNHLPLLPSKQGSSPCPTAIGHLPEVYIGNTGAPRLFYNGPSPNVWAMVSVYSSESFYTKLTSKPPLSVHTHGCTLFRSLLGQMGAWFSARYSEAPLGYFSHLSGVVSWCVGAWCSSTPRLFHSCSHVVCHSLD